MGFSLGSEYSEGEWVNKTILNKEKQEKKEQPAEMGWK